jgi:2-dehydropantoate 2-reductase
MSNPVQAMTGLGNAEIGSDPQGRELMIRLARESARVGLALGYKVPPFGGAAAETWADAGRDDVYAGLDAMLTPRGAPGRNWRASMAQDVLKGRRSEIEHMNGHVLAMGARVGIETPASAAVVRLMREIDAGARPPSPAAIETALRLAAS